MTEVPRYNLELNPDYSDWNSCCQRYYETMKLTTEFFLSISTKFISFNNYSHFFIKYSNSFITPALLLIKNVLISRN